MRSACFCCESCGCMSMLVVKVAVVVAVVVAFA